MKFIIAFSIVIILCLSCRENKQATTKPEGPDTSGTVLLIRTGVELEPKLLLADSIQIIYYDDPDGDSLRYSRFFSFLNTNDTGIIQKFKNELDAPASSMQQAKKCRSEGKVYLLNGEDPVKTIYFSTRSNDCSYLYFIKDGLFYYFSLSNEMKNIFKAQKGKARKH